MASDSKKSDKKTKSREDIINEFQVLRNEQRTLTGKLTELEADCNEHKIVIATLRNVSDDRRCFRLVGGVLTERKVKDVLQVLTSNHEKLNEVIEKVKEQITKKGIEINEHKEKYNITFRGIEKDEELTSNINSNDNRTVENRGNVLVS